MRKLPAACEHDGCDGPVEFCVTLRTFDDDPEAPRAMNVYLCAAHTDEAIHDDGFLNATGA